MPTLNEVFGISASIPKYTYVDRSGLDKRFSYSLSRDAHIVLHGGSKQGKTVLRRKNLPEELSVIVQCRASTTCANIYSSFMRSLKVSAPESLSLSGGAHTHVGPVSGEGTISSTSKPIGASIENLQFVSEQVLKSQKRVIIEDFHYMPEEEKRKLAFDLKAFWDLRVFFIIVGIWAEQNLLPYYNGDLAGRIDEIDVLWTDDELNQVLMKGQEALNIIIQPDMKQAMIEDASQNVGLLQRIAEKFCIHSGVYETVAETLGRTLSSQDALNKCRTEICAEEASRYRQFGDALSRGFKANEESELKVYQNIARAAIEAQDEELRSGLHYDTLFLRVSALNSRVRRSDFTAALQRLNRLQEDREVSPLVLSYNEKSRYLHLADRELLFYRKYGNPVWPWNSDAKTA